MTFTGSLRRLVGKAGAAVRPNGQPRRQYSVMTMARWETRYINEFIAYYRSIGFDHVYLYCNDDDPTELYVETAGYTEGPDPFVTFIHFPHQGQQWWILQHFLRTHKQETEWVALFDVDEFLSLRSAPTIQAFMAPRLAETDAIYFHWVYFGHNGHDQPPDGGVLRNYTRREPTLNLHTKTMTRTAAITLESMAHDVRHRGSFFLPHHGWNPITTAPMRCRDVLGNDMWEYYGRPRMFNDLYEPPGVVERMRAEAVLHHYAFKSRRAFLERVRRGLHGEFANQAMWGDRVATGETEAFLEVINQVEDTTLKDYWEGRLRLRTQPTAVEPAADEPLASLGKPALQSSVRNPAAGTAEVQAGRAVDGQVTGRFSFETAEEAAPWWQVDLLQTHAVAEVRLYNRMDDLALSRRAARFRLSASDDGARWRPVHEKLDDAPFGGADGRPFRWRPSPPIEARFLRLTLISRGPLHLDQVRVFGVPI